MLKIHIKKSKYVYPYHKILERTASDLQLYCLIICGIVLVLVALLIILVGVPYTILLFLWQWLVCAPKWKVFKWTRNTKLNAFVSVHHVPYNSTYRYWTGLLLLVRVVLYITDSIATSYTQANLRLLS